MHNWCEEMDNQQWEVQEYPQDYTPQELK